MANRYWVGGTGTWNNVAGSKWSTTSGGGGGSAVPTSSDDVFFDANSGAAVITVANNGSFPGTAVCKSLDFTGFTGTFQDQGSGTTTLGVAGSIILSSTMSSLYRSDLSLTGTTSLTIASAGKTLTKNLLITGAGATYTLQDALVMTGRLSLGTGTFTTNNKNLTLSQLQMFSNKTAVLNLGTSTVTFTSGSSGDPGIGFLGGVGSFTLNGSSSTIIFDATCVDPTLWLVSAVAAYSLNRVEFHSSGSASIYGLNSAGNDITIPTLVLGGQTQTIILSAPSVMTVTTLVAVGSAGAVISFISDTPGTQGVLSIASGIVSCNYISLTDIKATGGATFYAGAHSTNVSGNSGWLFRSPTATRDCGAENGEEYEVSLVVEGTSGQVQVSLGVGDSDTFTAGEGAVSFTGTYTAPGGIIITDLGNFKGTIDDICINEVT